MSVDCSDDTHPAVFRARERDDEGSSHGTLTLYVDDRQVAEADIKTQPGNFSLVGEGLAVGRDDSQPVSSDYETPFEFLGGTIRQVVVDVSGEAFSNVEKELTGMFHRD
ncbi:hypothetical protein [Streptomyces sp. NPDC055006]